MKEYRGHRIGNVDQAGKIKDDRGFPKNIVVTPLEDAFCLLDSLF